MEPREYASENIHVKLQVRELAHLPAGWWLSKRVGFKNGSKVRKAQAISSILYFSSSKSIYLLPILSSLIIDPPLYLLSSTFIITYISLDN